MSERWPEGAFSHTRFATLRQCTHKHQLQYVQKLQRKGTKPLALAVGDGFHVSLEKVALMALGNEDLTVEDWEAAVTSAIAQCKLEGPAKLEVTRLVGAYRLRHGEDNAGYGSHYIEHVEKILVAKDLHKDIGGFAAKADAITSDVDGNLWAWEHKTSGRMPSGTDIEIASGIRSRPQMKALAYCARDTFGRNVGVMHNLVTKTKLVGFKRVAVTFTDRELDRWAEEQKKLEALIPLDIQNHDACDPPVGYRCQFFEKCHSEDPVLHEQLFQIRTPHR